MPDPRYPPHPLTLMSICLRKTLTLCGDVSDVRKPRNFDRRKNLHEVKLNIKSLQLISEIERDLLLGMGRVLSCPSLNVLASSNQSE